MTGHEKSTRHKFKITYDASLLTLITFGISMVTLTWQIFNYFEGAQVKMIAPDQVTIGSSDAMKVHNRDGGPYVHFIARLSYVNQASSGYNATVRLERVRVTLKGHEAFEQQWYDFTVSDADGDQLTFDKRVASNPFPLAAGSSESHETIFQPWPRNCQAGQPACKADDYYIDWSKFLDLFKADRVADFEFQAYVYGRSEPVTARCRVALSERQYQNMAARGWVSPVCSAA
jgi:hypothetical protein